MSHAVTARKPKKCAAKNCDRTFCPLRSTERVCSIDCAIAFASDKKKKEFKAETRAMRNKFLAKDRKYQLRLAQFAFNAFIRERDKCQPCISCGSTDQNLRYDAGHFRTIGAHPELRFDEDNCHRQCHYNCNINRSGNITEYRIGLVKRIGIARVEFLECEHTRPKLSVEEIIQIKNLYKSKLKQLQQDRAA